MKYITLLLFVFSCENSSQQILTTINGLYSTNYFDFKLSNNNILTSNFTDLLLQAKEKEKNEIDKVKQSQFPDEKPFIIDRNIFTSANDGFETYKIINLTISGNEALVKLEFQNKSLNIVWIDQLSLIKTDRWRIDNIIYSNQSGFSDCKNLLNDYLKSSK